MQLNYIKNNKELKIYKIKEWFNKKFNKITVWDGFFSERILSSSWQFVSVSVKSKANSYKKNKLSFLIKIKYNKYSNTIIIIIFIFFTLNFIDDKLLTNLIGPK